jgi:hypothetical protein
LWYASDLNLRSALESGVDGIHSYEPLCRRFQSYHESLDLREREVERERDRERGRERERQREREREREKERE